MRTFTSATVGLLSILVGGHYVGYWNLHNLLRTTKDETERWSCRPFLPNLFSETPPPAHAVQDAVDALDRHLTARFAKGDIDSLSIAVVTSTGVLYEKNFGVMRANETDSPPTHSHSIYRIASVGKLFPVLEGFVLAQKRLISWDDPIDKYIQNFKYVSDGLDKDAEFATHEHPPITLRQLASHMSGLGRDWPPGTVAGWPHDLRGMGPPPTNGLPFPSYEALFASIAEGHLTSPPAAYPAYSNAGVALLSYALAAASSASTGDASKISYADLLKRDIFDPMGMNGTSFLATEATKHLIVVPSLGPEVVDQDFLDAMNPAGGQFSSLSDMITAMQTFLNPTHPKSQITSYSMRNWLQSVHTFDEDDWTEMGFMWEIIKARDSYGRLRKIYWKLGEMVGFHTALAIHPGTGYGVVVLMTGHYADSAKIAYDVFDVFQPSIDKALAGLATQLYVGEWRDIDKAAKEESTARIIIDKGTLYVEQLTLAGVDALKNFGAPGRLALRSSERRDEFRLDTGIPGYNGVKHMGCYPYWNGQDLWGVRNNAAVNALYFSGSGEDRRLHIPSLSLVLERVSAV